MMQCPFCKKNELAELNQNEHGNILYICSLCGTMHSSEFPKGDGEQILVYRVDMDGQGYMYVNDLKSMWESIERTFFDYEKRELLDMPCVLKIETAWINKAEFEALEPFEL